MIQYANKVMGLSARELREGCEAEKGKIFLTCSVIWKLGMCVQRVVILA